VHGEQRYIYIIFLLIIEKQEEISYFH